MTLDPSATPAPFKPASTPAIESGGSPHKWFGQPHMPLPLVGLTLLIILSHALVMLLLQPAVYWLDPLQNNEQWYTPLLDGGPLFYMLGVAVYLLVTGLLLTRLRRPLALTLAAALFFFHYNFVLWQAHYGWPPFVRFTTTLSGNIFQVGMQVVVLPLAAWLAIRALGSGRIRWWERWLFRTVNLGWLIFLVVSLAASVIPVIRSQVVTAGWHPLVTAHRPPARTYPALAYNPVRHQAVLFGGRTRNAEDVDIFLDDTWLWDGRDWIRMDTPGEIPPARAGAALGYDEAHQTMILYGGGNKYGDLADIWEWNGSAWRRRCPSCNPAARVGARMLYDPEQKKLMLYGGFAGDEKENTWYTEGWFWNGEGWGYAEYKNSSPAARDFGAVYDTSRQRSLFFFPGDNGGTWTFTNQTKSWSPLRLPVEPPHAYGPVLVFDPNSAQSLLFGGWAKEGYNSQTWLFDGSTWRKLELPLAPAPRCGAAAFYDPVRESIILFGGQELIRYDSDLWEFRMPGK